MARRRVKKKAKRIATFGVISIVIVVMTSIALGSLFLDILDKYNEKKNLESKLVALQDKQKELEQDVKKLEDPEYLARYAREKYFYSKDGELILRIPEKSE